MFLICPRCREATLDECGKRHIICLSCDASFALEKKPWRAPSVKAAEIEKAKQEDIAATIYNEKWTADQTLNLNPPTIDRFTP